MALKIRRGTDGERLGIVPVLAEPLFTTDSKRLYIGDGETPGGVAPFALEEDQDPKLGADLDLNGNNIVGTGSIFITGTITASGTVELGGENGGGQIASNVVPLQDATFDLGTSSNNWKTLWAESTNIRGVAQVSTLQIDTNIVTPDSTVVFDVATNTLSVNNITASSITAGGPLLAESANISGVAQVSTLQIDANIVTPDSTVVFDVATNTLSVNDITASSITAGEFFGSFFSDDSTTIIDGLTGNLSNGTLSFVDDVITGTTSATLYDQFVTPNEPIVAIGTRDNPQALFVEGTDFPLTIRGAADAVQGTNIDIQSARFNGTTLDTIQNGDFLGQIIMSGFAGVGFKKSAVLSSIVTSAVVGNNFNADLQVSVLNADGLYRQFSFQADGVFDAGLALKVYNATDVELTGFASIADEGTFGYGADRDAPVFFNGAAFNTLTSVVAVPSGPTAAGKAGQIAGDANYIYFCYGNSTWVRVAKDATWT